MIVEYHRPTQMGAALALLARKEIKTIPIGGGTKFRRDLSGDFAVVDLQSLGLDQIGVFDKGVEIGARVSMQALSEAGPIPAILRQAAALMGGLNYRNQATAAGEVVAGDGRSAFLSVLLACDARLYWQPDGQDKGLGDYLALRDTWRAGGLIHHLIVPTNCSLSFEYVARTQKDRPILIVSLCRWASGRTRVALGGFGKAPILAMDGSQAGGEVQAARSAYAHAGDAWASAEYRSEVAGDLIRRLLGEKVEIGK